jgi:putative ATPase
MTPLAHLLRPTRFEDYIGQSHLVGKGKVITRMVEEGSVPSLLFWGPPGCGKTTLAQLIATALDAVFVSISAVESGTSDIKAIIQSAKRRRTELPTEPTHTILFIDEIHRFNKLQQDALLAPSGLCICLTNL